MRPIHSLAAATAMASCRMRRPFPTSPSPERIVTELSVGVGRSAVLFIVSFDRRFGPLIAAVARRRLLRRLLFWRLQPKIVVGGGAVILAREPPLARLF